MQSVDMSTGHFCCLLVSGMIILSINEAINHYLLRFLYYPLLAFSYYCNLVTPDQRHGDYDAALQAAAASGKPIFANFVEWSG